MIKGGEEIENEHEERGRRSQTNHKQIKNNIKTNKHGNKQVRKRLSTRREGGDQSQLSRYCRRSLQTQGDDDDDEQGDCANYFLYDDDGGYQPILQKKPMEPR